jgi:hypothetical protein
VVSFPQFHHHNPVHTSPLPIQATCPTNLTFLDFITRTIMGWGGQIMQLLIMKFSLHPYYLFPLRPKYWKTKWWGNTG